ncbi:SDR family oxidoreductase [Dyadobacter sediminis]|uniref:SDR family NAD(P)-dependent oxidoreductase n=1 Tax=Dyadobacter sediminis TaxID=1493691 RepID=A0A5R9KC10_9BACT|nr:SDR family NAD(P)-dependent oxidoreductase [Dyadobacter sediminis]TLU92383.1 SDR family NAD(P)-dependent oxidoreductase [Dyadobacter sediminis]GGB94900.1 putative oxidoreductase DltE [Dyadobacter sediminis]
MNVTGNTVLITGGTSGIGLAFAEEWIKEGSRVIITGRRADRLEAIKKRLPGIITRVSDVSDAAQRTGLAEWILQNYPETNVLINNAGIQLVTDLKSPVDLERVRSETETNFIAPLHLASLFTPHFAEKEEAAIINITSGLAFAPLAFMPVYCATKAAMHSLSLSLRHQLKHTGIKVFEIAPPAVDTELGHDRREDKSQSHGGISVQEFIAGAMEAIKKDELEAAIGQAAGLRVKREALFEQMNP